MGGAGAGADMPSIPTYGKTPEERKTAITERKGEAKKKPFAVIDRSSEERTDEKKKEEIKPEEQPDQKVEINKPTQGSSGLGLFSGMFSGAPQPPATQSPAEVAPAHMVEEQKQADTFENV